MDQNTTQEVTLEQLLNISVEQLNNIVVPMPYLESIGFPVSRVINNLKIGIKAINDAKTTAKSDEPQVEFVEAKPIESEGDIS